MKTSCHLLQNLIQITLIFTALLNNDLPVLEMIVSWLS